MVAAFPTAYIETMKKAYFYFVNLNWDFLKSKLTRGALMRIVEMKKSEIDSCVLHVTFITSPILSLIGISSTSDISRIGSGQTIWLKKVVDEVQSLL